MMNLGSQKYGVNMSPIDKAKAKEIVEDYIRREMFKMEPVEDTSNLFCYGITDFSEYHVFWYSCKMHNMIGAGSYVGIHKQNSSLINFDTLVKTPENNFQPLHVVITGIQNHNMLCIKILRNTFYESINFDCGE